MFLDRRGAEKFGSECLQEKKTRLRAKRPAASPETEDPSDRSLPTEPADRQISLGTKKDSLAGPPFAARVQTCPKQNFGEPARTPSGTEQFRQPVLQSTFHRTFRWTALLPDRPGLHQTVNDDSPGG